MLFSFSTHKQTHKRECFLRVRPKDLVVNYMKAVVFCQFGHKKKYIIMNKPESNDNILLRKQSLVFYSRRTLSYLLSQLIVYSGSCGPTELPFDTYLLCHYSHPSSNLQHFKSPEAQLNLSSGCLQKQAHLNRSNILFLSSCKP